MKLQAATLMMLARVRVIARLCMRIAFSVMTWFLMLCIGGACALSYGVFLLAGIGWACIAGGALLLIGATLLFKGMSHG